jgi:hypothetical protein
VFNANNIKLNDELIQLYEWHNGISFFEKKVTQPYLELLPMGIPYSLEYAIEAKKQILSLDYLELDNLADFLPFFGSGEDDMYLYKQGTGEIYYISPAVQNFGSLEFTSLREMFDFIIECYSIGILNSDSENGLEIDYDEYETIKRNLNK